MTGVADPLTAITSRRADLLADVERLVRCESPSTDLAAVARSAEVVAAVLRDRLPGQPEVLDVDGCRHVRWRSGPGPTRVLILAHHDTVWPLGTLDRLPFVIDEAAGTLRGPGTVDMKAGLAQAVHALAVVADDPVGLPDGVTLLVTGDEEIGSTTSRALIEAEALRGEGPGGAATAVLVLEGSGPHGAIKTGRKGTATYHLTVTGRASHAGVAPERGINAVVELAHVVSAVLAVADPDRGTTVTPTVVSGGSATNTVPASATVGVDVRCWTIAEQDRVDRDLRVIAPTLPGARIEVEGRPNRPPMERAISAELFARAQAVAGRAGLPVPAECAVGGGSDGNFTAALGVPTLDGLGAAGGGAHADDEHVDLASLLPRTALLVALLRDLLA